MNYSHSLTLLMREVEQQQEKNLPVLAVVGELAFKLANVKDKNKLV